MKRTILSLFFALLMAMAAMAQTTYSKALEEKAIKGDADAMLELSTCYRFAMGIKKDIDWANYWLECAAKAGSTKALTVLTSLGDNGTGLKDAKRRELDLIVQRKQNDLVDDRAVGIDYSKYNDALYRKAQGGDAEAQYNLGDCYFYGRGVAKDYDKSAYWWRKAANQNYPVAVNDLGYCYENGLGVTKDLSQAVDWYRKAAQLGHPMGQFNLGNCYYTGTGVSKDYDEATYWFRKSAEQGNSSGQNMLGYCYRHGDGVPQSDSQGVYWYRKAAEQDHATAQFNLAYCYENGYGVSKDISQAIYWYRKAADQGYEAAQDALNLLDTNSNSGTNQTFTVGGVSFTMVYVEGGSFVMGATSEQADEAYDDEKPIHRVYLSSYYIGQTEVTQELWEAVMGSNPSEFYGSKRPVEMVTWDDCQNFIRKLNQKTGKNFRLPTEEEWEYAARGGNLSKQYKYSGSNSLSDVAWFTNNSNSNSHNVATKRSNELGIYDMSGNVWEWCQNMMYNYDGSSYNGSDRVYRGGSWLSDYDNCRVSLRNGRSASFNSNNIGLRLAL